MCSTPRPQRRDENYTARWRHPVKEGRSPYAWMVVYQALKGIATCRSARIRSARSSGRSGLEISIPALLFAALLVPLLVHLWWLTHLAPVAGLFVNFYWFDGREGQAICAVLVGVALAAVPGTRQSTT